MTPRQNYAIAEFCREFKEEEKINQILLSELILRYTKDVELMVSVN